MLRFVSRRATSGACRSASMRSFDVTRATLSEAFRAGQNGPMDAPTSSHDFDAVVVGAGHNGLVCAAYLAKDGLRTLLIEARDSVGGTAASEGFAGATVNICNCDHITFRTTPVMDELRLADHGLRYI